MTAASAAIILFRLWEVDPYMEAEEDRINKLKLNPDRADVIVPATDIYLSAMKWAGADQMRVPDIGLKDGMLLMLYENAVGKGR